MNPDNLMDGYDINQSEFPFLNKQNVQKTVTQFNYNVWGAKTRLYFKHVPASWASDYEHVVCFADKQTRDAYFKDAEPKVLETEFRIPHDGVVRLPYPYDEIINFNYLVAEYPQIPVPDGNLGPHRLDYFYFIEDCDYISPNCTEVKITLDVWTTYINDIDVNNMTLERGHYAVANAADVDTYLANPLNNRLFIGTADVSFGEICKISKNNTYQLAGGNVYVVVASYSRIIHNEYHEPIEHTGFQVDENPDRATYSTYCYHGTGANYEKGVDYFAVDWSNWSDFCELMRDNFPAFFQTIQGCLVITDKYVPVDRSNVIYLPFDNNHTIPLYESIGGITQAIDYSFTQADFGYSNKYNWLTKLYTYPYAAVEYVDQNGASNIIKYEDLYFGRFTVNIFCNLCVGAPKARAVILNVGANGVNGDFNMHAIDIPVPTSPIHLNQYENYIVHTRHSRTQELDAIQTGYNNAEDSANVAQTNANLSAATAKTNSDYSVSNSRKNADKNNEIINSGVNKDGTTGINYDTNLQAKEFTADNIRLSKKILDENVDYNKEMADKNAKIQAQSFFVNANQHCGQALVSAAGQAIRSDLNMIATVGSMALGGVAAARGVTQAGVAAGRAAAKAKESPAEIANAIAEARNVAGATAMYNGTMSVGAALAGLSFQGVNDKNVEALWTVFKALTECSGSNFALNNAAINGSKGYYFKFGTTEVDWEGFPLWPFDNFKLAAIHCNQPVSAQNGIINNHMIELNRLNRYYEKEHNNKSYETAEKHRNSIYQMNKDINKNNYDTANGISERSKNTAVTISANSRSLAGRINIANRNLGVHGVNNALRQSKFDNMFTAGSTGDVSGWDSSRAKIQYHIKTQDADSIAKAGDYFLKYGYKYDGVINFTGFNIMNHFTYWKCSDIWLDSTSVNNNIVKQIRAILMNGVTVWRNPSELGAINIYNNRVAV